MSRFPNPNWLDSCTCHHVGLDNRKDLKDWAMESHRSRAAEGEHPRWRPTDKEGVYTHDERPECEVEVTPVACRLCGREQIAFHTICKCPDHQLVHPDEAEPGSQRHRELHERRDLARRKYHAVCGCGHAMEPVRLGEDGEPLWPSVLAAREFSIRLYEAEQERLARARQEVEAALHAVLGQEEGEPAEDE